MQHLFFDMTSPHMELKKIYYSFLTKIDSIDSIQERESITFLVLEKIFKIKKIDLYSNILIHLDLEKEKTLNTIAQRINQHEPIQYILGETMFYDCVIQVTPAVLIPRPETEEIVDKIIKDHKHQSDLTIMDIGTGSGCIAIALAKKLHPHKIYGIDISTEALKLARNNAAANNVNIDFQHRDILQVPLWKEQNIDIIVSNPPYVRESEKKYMQKNVLNYEPSLALFVPNQDPLLFYEKIADIAMYTLHPKGALYIEINEALGEETKGLLKNKSFAKIDLFKDLNGKERFIRATMT